MGDTPEPQAGADRSLAQEARETRIEVAVAMAIVIGFQAVLAWLSLRNGWVLFHVHGWIWWVPIPLEVILLGLLVIDRSGSVDPGSRRRREGIVLLAFLAFWNAVTVTLLILELFTGEVRTGGELIMEATVVLATLVFTFGLLFWELDGGGPRMRAVDREGERDFLFSEMTVDRPGLVPPDWHPRLVDYTYLAFVTAIAWSAADTLPLTRRAKVLMAAETAIAALTILLVAARAISIFG
ncbi:MAG: hypothetical protein KGR19_10755 [Acidobacteria bacterium]|nr:hypothetical protein [Acidobacteriota bacterium]